MGNAQSTSPSSTSRRGFKRQRSGVFSRLSLGCASVGDTVYSSDPTQDTFSLVHEKASFRDHQSPAQLALAYAPHANADTPPDASQAYASFLREFPEYQLTWILDTLRRTDFSRLERTGETYVDYMGGSLYPESLIRVHTEFLSQNVLGNTHSVSNSSKLSLRCADEARAAVLAFFKAPPEYTVVFTANASGALKLVGESYPFTAGGSFVLGNDSHNSIHGIREFAMHRGARVSYIPSTAQGGFNLTTAKHVLLSNRPTSRDLAPCLFALTAQSNISNSKNPLSIISHASSLGYHVLLDAAALAPTSSFSLSEHRVDAMAVSFYKMFGFPTGVGALIVKKSFLAELERPWFAGGTVDVVQVPGSIVTRAHEAHEQFEDGTINYLTLPAITDGLRFLSTYLPFLPLRLSALLHYLVSSLVQLRHDTTDEPVVRVLSRPPSRRLSFIGDQADTGSTVSLIFLSPTGEMIPNSFIEYSASTQNISLRTGCMCNPGAAAALLGIEEDMQLLCPGVTLKDFENVVGHELGVVRISLGLASNFQDVWNVLRFAAMIGTQKARQTLWDRWLESTRIGQAI